MPRDYDNRNKTKSWREIDKEREGKKDGRDDRQESFEDKARRNSGAYNTYKKDLDNLFSGGEVPVYLKDVASTKEDSKLKLLGKIQRAISPAELADAMKAYLKKYEDFPDDFDLLLRVVEYEDEKVQLMAVRALDRMSRVLPVDHKQQFILKLDNIAMMADDDDLRELSQELLDRLR
jgi:hypothetical protein